MYSAADFAVFERAVKKVAGRDCKVYPYFKTTRPFKIKTEREVGRLWWTHEVILPDPLGYIQFDPSEKFLLNGESWHRLVFDSDYAIVIKDGAETDPVSMQSRRHPKVPEIVALYVRWPLDDPNVVLSDIKGYRKRA